MLKSLSRLAFASAGFVAFSLVACGSSDDATTPPASAGAGGSSNTNAGAAGKSPSAGSAGAIVTAGSGGAKTGGSAGAAIAGAGGTSTVAGAGGSDDLGGSAGAGGADLTPPTTCAAAHGQVGCCLGTMHYFVDDDGTIGNDDCGVMGQICTYDPNLEAFDCEDPSDAMAAPASTPAACGGAIDSVDSGCTITCATNADCTDASAPACDPTGMVCVQCTADTDCTTGAKKCDVGSFTCLACATNADCATSDTGSVCDVTTNECVACVVDGDCTLGPKKCDTEGNVCIECAINDDCAGNPNGGVCDASVGLCIACLSDFDCAAAAPVCDPGDGLFTPASCVPGGACAGDDALEDKDDAATGATALTSGKTDSAHKICDAPDEADWFSIVAKDGDSLEVVVTSPDPTTYVSATVFDEATMNQIAIDRWEQPNDVHANFLTAGTYLIRVNKVDPTNDTGMADATTAYVITATLTAGKCQTVADCGTDGTTQAFRGSCNATSGACVAIDGKMAGAAGSVCDSPDDCASGLCAGSAYSSSPATRSVCTIACSADVDCTTAGTICDVDDGFCVQKCTKDSECPVSDFSSPPLTAGDTWNYNSCDATTGLCDQPADPGGDDGGGTL